MYIEMVDLTSIEDINRIWTFLLIWLRQEGALGVVHLLRYIEQRLFKQIFRVDICGFLANRQKLAQAMHSMIKIMINKENATDACDFTCDTGKNFCMCLWFCLWPGTPVARFATDTQTQAPGYQPCKFWMKKFLYFSLLQNLRPPPPPRVQKKGT